MEDDDQTRRKVPNSRSPDSRLGFGRETGRETPIPDSAGIGNREIPRFPIRPGPGIAVPRAFLEKHLSIELPLTAHDPIHP